MATLQEQTTKGFAILNEETMQMETIKETDNWRGYGNTLLFATEDEAEEHAAGKLELWQVIKIHFNHKCINHTINTN